MHHDPKPKDTDSEDEAGVERKKPEGSWFPPKREKGSNTSDVSSTIIFSIVKSFFLCVLSLCLACRRVWRAIIALEKNFI